MKLMFIHRKSGDCYYWSFDKFKVFSQNGKYLYWTKKPFEFFVNNPDFFQYAACRTN